MHILLVDDDAFMRRLISKYLSEAGYEVRTARNGRLALSALTDHEARIVVTDWVMPEMDGIELCKAIRARDEIGYVFIILLTSRSGSERAVQGLRAGADDFVTKPVDREELLARVGAGVRIIKLESDLETQNRAVHKANAELGLLNDRVLRQRRRLEVALQKARKASTAAEIEHRKNMFFTRMTHELRTPLNGILGMTDLLLTGDASPPVKQKLKMVKTSSLSLLEIVNNVLDQARLDADRIELEYITFDPRETMQSALTTIAPEALRKGIDVSLSTAPDVPPTVQGDPGRFRQILLNLLANAVKFTTVGSVSVEATVEKESPENLTLLVSVEDTGIGIAPEVKQRIFDPFVQQDESTTRKYGGTGLGLTISKQLVERMGGRIQVDSTPGRGSRFSFTVVFGYGDDSAADAQVGGATKQTPKGLRILLAEDDPVNQAVALGFLEELGHAIVPTCDGLEAIDEFRRSSFDVVFLDVQMPGKDGVQTAAAVREYEKLLSKRVPILAMTANADARVRRACLEAGMDGFLTKPLSRERLAQVLAKHASGKPAQRDRGDTPPAGALGGEMPQSSAPAGSAIVQNDRLFRQVSGVFLKQGPAILADIRDAVGDEEWVAVAKAAHKLKGAVSYFDAHRLRHAVAELESIGASGDRAAIQALIEAVDREMDQLCGQLEATLRKSEQEAPAASG